MQNPQAVRDLIHNHQYFILTSHIDPDGDGLGGILGLAHALRSIGKTALCCLSGSFGERYRFLPGSDQIQTGLPADAPKDGSTVFISVDAANLERLGFADDELKSLNPRILNIDHHKSNEHFGDAEWFDVDCSSSCEAIWLLIKELDIPFTAEMGTCLYTGLLTDTGRFRFSNTTPRAFQCGADLTEAGANHALVIRKLFEEQTWEKLTLEKLALQTLHRDGPLAWMHVTETMTEEAGTDDTEEFVNKMTVIKGMEIAAFFREAQGKTKISLRSVNDMDVNAIANLFGGGGHAKAAGARLELPLDKAIQTVLNECRKALKTAGLIS